ncbi:T-complex protein 11-like protein 2 [Chaetodon auriga]|uniref:T-complex protein 11-like protein 2 n=1 Tax=Chaetodon auriga TaxID=39042 RepID=UPI004032A719
MPLNDERPASTSSGEDQGSDVESSSERYDSMTSTSDLECSRESFTSDGSSKHCTPSSSPPIVLTLDEVMETASDLFNLTLAHEINVNRDFHLEQPSLPQNCVWKVVKEMVHKAFWNILESELNDDPPEYGQAIILLEDIREILLSFLNPGANRMRTQIMEVLDIDLIRQQADNDAVDIQGLASYIITTMGKICAPIRDGDIKKLRENPDNIVTLFKEIFRVLDLMKVDMVNHSIKSLRVVLQREGVEYERAKFQCILDKTPNGLNHTTSWIKLAVEELQSAIVPKGQENGQQAVLGPFQILNTAFLHILTWDFSKNPLPETWVTDEMRLREIQQQLQQCQMVNEVLLIVHSTIGGPVQGLSFLSDRLKRMTSVLLDGMHSPNFNLEEALEGVSAQICCELNKSLTERDYPALTPALQAILRGQICSITQKDNSIRILVEDRVQQYFKVLISDPKSRVEPEQIPAGLTAIKPELALLGAEFISLVKYNKTVYGPFYADIIRKLVFSNNPPAANPPQDAACETVPSS